MGRRRAPRVHDRDVHLGEFDRDEASGGLLGLCTESTTVAPGLGGL